MSAADAMGNDQERVPILEVELKTLNSEIAALSERVAQMTPYVDELKTKTQEQRREHKQLSQRKLRLQAQLDSLGEQFVPQIQAVVTEIERARVETEGHRRTFRAEEEEHTRLTREKEELERAIAELKQRHNALKARFEQLVPRDPSGRPTRKDWV